VGSACSCSGACPALVCIRLGAATGGRHVTVVDRWMDGWMDGCSECKPGICHLPLPHLLTELLCDPCITLLRANRGKKGKADGR
jgi:hypothetical protein